MPGELSDYAEKGLLDHMLKRTEWTFAGVRYFGISRNDPLDDGSGVLEPTDPWYARQQITGAQWNNAAGRQINNSAEIAFPTVADNDVVPGTGMHWVMFDALTGGNYLGKAQMPGNPTLQIGSVPTIEIGTFVLSWITGAISDYAARLLLEHFVVKNQWAQLANLYAFLSETSPGDDFTFGGTPTEPTGNDYARVPANSWNDVTSGPGTTNNSAEIQFPKASGPWRSGNPLNYFGLYDNITAGNGLMYGSLTGAITVDANERPRFLTGQWNFAIN